MDDEEKRIFKESEWQSTKSEIPFGFENKELDFGRQKATNIKKKKQKALFEVRRKDAAKMYDDCMKELGDGADKSGRFCILTRQHVTST